MDIRHLAAGIGLGVLIATGLPGCGGSTTPQAPAASGGSSASPARGPTTPATSATANAVPADGPKSIGGVPYDVWFDDPLGTVADTQSVAAAPNPSPAVPKEEMPAAVTPSAPTASADNGGSEWGQYISMDQIQEETKQLRNRLTASMQSLAKFNSDFKEIQADAAVLAAMAVIVEQHPESATWKPNSRFVQEFAAKMQQTSAALGRESYDKTQVEFERVSAVLNGNVPADAGALPAQRPPAEIASRWGAMKKMEKVRDWMKANLTTEANFKADLPRIQQDGSILVALSALVADHSYESADEEDYQKYAQQLIDASKAAVAAGKAEDFAAFTTSIQAIQKACGDCHNDYGTN
ncbi:MAG: cytochrome c [Planctomycetaceae bacterium]|nr:cytochrome c [Planctomycetaceae bacterium]